ncbi:hypothetical protein [Streptomyces sp. NBC_00986]|uniref:hypothetical protein n=1 Tax=Streptomyces sp. NBC_00986 TaxID=2903702 RepID=UPI0038633FFC|nr:hypothetical protein OG504_26555 [Streptomyces sp. NBC_00986]
MIDQRRGQLETAAVILGLARPMVDDDAPLTADELRWIARRLVESLTDVLGIAASQHHAPPKHVGGDRRNAPIPSITRP